MVTRGQFITNVLHQLGVKVDVVGTTHWKKCMLALLAQSYAESGMELCNGISGAKNNPLNTTYDLKPNTNFNSVGVKNYATTSQGENATADTYKLSPYAAVVKALRDPNVTLSDIANAIAASPWGTGDLEFSALSTLRRNPLKLRKVRNLTVGP